MSAVVRQSNMSAIPMTARIAMHLAKLHSSVMVVNPLSDCECPWMDARAASDLSVRIAFRENQSNHQWIIAERSPRGCEPKWDGRADGIKYAWKTAPRQAAQDPQTWCCIKVSNSPWRLLAGHWHPRNDTPVNDTRLVRLCVRRPDAM